MSQLESLIRPRTYRRQPWDERAPDGTPAMEMGLNPHIQRILARIRGEDAPPNAGPMSPIGPSSQTSTPSQSPQDSYDIERSTGQETRPWKAGYAVGETDPLRREAARIRAMAENPTSNVLPSGAVETPHPMSRKRAALLGLLYGAGMGAQTGDLAGTLSGAATGAGIGLADPRAIQEWRRRMEVEDAQAQLARQQQIGLGQARLESEQSQAEYQRQRPTLEAAEIRRKMLHDSEQLKIQRDLEAGRISRAEADRKTRENVARANRESRETEGRLNRENQRTVAGIRSGGTDKTAANRSKREAKLNEASSYYKKADGIDANAEALNAEIKKLEDGMASMSADPANPPLPEQLKPFQEQIQQLKTEQEKLRGEARDLRAKGDGARSEGESIPEETSTQQTGGRKWSASKWKAANPKGDVEAAKAAARDAGYTVIE